MEDLKYKSKTDLWVYIVIIGSCAAMLPLLFLKPFSWVVFFIVAGICLFMLDMLFNTHYIIKGDVLVIRSGVFRRSVGIHSIKEISSTRSILSSPALSFDRIAVRYGKYDEILISPKDKDAFICRLLEVNNNIIVTIK